MRRRNYFFFYTDFRETAVGASRYGKERKSRSGAGSQNISVSDHGMHRYQSIGLVRVFEVTDFTGNRGGTANENIRPRGGLYVRLGDFLYRGGND